MRQYLIPFISLALLATEAMALSELTWADMTAPFHYKKVVRSAQDLQKVVTAECPNESSIQLAAQNLHQDFLNVMFSKRRSSNPRNVPLNTLINIFKSCLPQSKDSSQFYMQKYGSLFFVLFSEKTYDDTVSTLQNLFAQHELQSLIPYLQEVGGIDRPADCPDTSLASNVALRGPLRLTRQHHDICYVHSTVRALDYFNQTVNSEARTTSIIATAVQANEFRRSDELDINFGFQSIIFNYLVDKNGCGLTELDQLPPGEGERKLIELNTAFREMQTSFSNVSELPEINIQGNLQTPEVLQALWRSYDTFRELGLKSQSWSPVTMDVLKKALRLDDIDFTTTQGLITSINRVGQLTNTYKRLTSPSDRRFMSFADFVFRAGYCKGTPISYANANLRTLFRPLRYGTFGGRRFIRASNEHKEVVQEVSTSFRLKVPQPIIVSFCNEVLDDVAYVRGVNCGNHSALIVGQTYDHRIKQCSYKLLNSYGANANYHPTYDADSNHDIVWIPSPQFLEATYEMDQIRDRRN